MSYRTVKESFWTDPKIRQLSPDEKLLFLYCVTNPHSHYSGLYYLPVVFMIEETGMDQKMLIQCLANLESRLLIRYDKDTSTMFVVKMFKHQNSTGGNPKVIRSGVEKQLQIIHSHSLINAFIKEYQYLKLTLPQCCVKVDSTLVQGSGSDTGSDTVPEGVQGGDNTAIDHKVEFESRWKRYPNKDGKKESFRHFKASVNTEQDLADIDLALDKYIAHLSLKENSWKRPKNGSTWFNNWRDWIQWQEPQTNTVAVELFNALLNAENTKLPNTMSQDGEALFQKIGLRWEVLQQKAQTEGMVALNVSAK